MFHEEFPFILDPLSVPQSGLLFRARHSKRETASNECD
jgi:hypothetical protein